MNWVIRFNTKKFIVILFYLSVLFPYINVFPFYVDIQPNALVISCVYLLINNKKILSSIKKDFALDYFLFFITLLIPIVYFDFSFNAVRAIVVYMSFIIVPICGYYILKDERKIREGMIKKAIMVWLFVGLVQNFIKSDFLSFLLIRMSTGGDRGVTSLATEPTNYGYVCLFFIVFCLMFKSEKGKYILISLFQLIFLARSTTAILLLFIGIVIIVIYKYYKSLYFLFAIFISIFLIIGLFYLVTTFLPDSRMATLLIKILDNPYKTITTDGSVNQRLGHIIFAIKGSLDNFLIPRGYSAFGDYSRSVYIAGYSDVAFVVGNRILSGLGGTIFELGIFSLIVIFQIKNKVSYTIQGKMGKAIGLWVVIIMFMAISISMPLLHFLLSIGVYNKYKENGG